MSSGNEEMRLAKPFLSATVNVLKSMAATELKYGTIDSSKNSLASRELCCLVGFSSDTLKGCFIMSFSKAAICGVVERMLMQKPSDIDNEVRETLAEIASMIVTGAKAGLGDDAKNFVHLAPILITGSSSTIDSISGGISLVVPFISQDGGFELGFKFAQ